MEDHDLLIRIDERMDNIEKMLDGGGKTFRSHDDRLRELENNQSKFTALIIFIGSLITIVLNGALYLLGKLWK